VSQELLLLSIGITVGGTAVGLAIGAVLRAVLVARARRRESGVASRASLPGAQSVSPPGFASASPEAGIAEVDPDSSPEPE